MSDLIDTLARFACPSDAERRELRERILADQATNAKRDAAALRREAEYRTYRGKRRRTGDHRQ
jgi:hypothetical protein